MFHHLEEKSCENLHAPQWLPPHTRSLNPYEYVTGTTFLPADLSFLHVITHVLKDKHRPDPSQVTWKGISYSIMKYHKTVYSHDIPPGVPVSATTNPQCSFTWRTLLWGFCDHPDVTLFPTCPTVRWMKYGEWQLHACVLSPYLPPLHRIPKYQPY